MEKYRFDRKLQEAVLRRNEGQQPAIIIDGEEMKVRCPSFVGAGTGDILCLVKEDSKTGNAGDTVVAVLFDGLDTEEKSWACIQPMLIEQSIGFFLENNQMDEMAGDCSKVISLPATGRGMPDFQAGNTCIEVRVSMPVSYRSGGLMWLDFIPAIEQILKYYDGFEGDKRMVLLAVCQHGTGHIQAMPDENTKKELKKAVSKGIELWVAETMTENEGISLMSCQNFTDNILKG